MKFTSNLTAVALTILCSSIAHAETDPRVRFITSEAIASGSGCLLNQNAFLTNIGAKLSLLLTDLAIDLRQNSANPSMAARSTCMIRVPTDVPIGYYVSETTDFIDATVLKTAGAIGTISIRSSLFGFSTSPLTFNLVQGQRLNQPVRTIVTNKYSAQTTPSWVAGWCARNRQLRGLLQTNISVSGQIATRNDDLSIAFGYSNDGIEIGNIKLSRCQN